MTQPTRQSGGGRDRGPNPWVLLAAGTELGLSVALLSLGGWWLDKRWETSPWLLLTGLAIGAIGGMYRLYRIGKRSF